MMKQAVIFLLALALVMSVGVPWQTGTAGTQPNKKAGEKAQEKSVVKKYPPYPDVWGYEFQYPDKADRSMHIDVAKMPDGEYVVTYRKGPGELLRKDGTCCDFSEKFSALSFFSTERKGLSGETYNTFWKENRANRVRADSVVFEDGSLILREGSMVGNCYEAFPFSIVKKIAGQIVAKKVFVYLPKQPQMRQINGGRCAEPEQTIEQKVEEVHSMFVRLEDGTFLLYDAGGNFILRLDKDFNTKYRLNDTIFLVDADVIEKAKREAQDDQSILNAVYQYVLDLKRRNRQ